MGYGTHKDGTPVTGAEVQAWADEAEVGYDVEELERRGRPRRDPGASTAIQVRLDPELSLSLARRAESERTTRSEVVRAALRAWLSGTRHSA